MESASVLEVLINLVIPVLIKYRYSYYYFFIVVIKCSVRVGLFF